MDSGRRPIKVRFQSARGLAQSKTWRTYPCFITREAPWALPSRLVGVGAARALSRGAAYHQVNEGSGDLLQNGSVSGMVGKT